MKLDYCNNLLKRSFHPEASELSFLIICSFFPSALTFTSASKVTHEAKNEAV